MIETRVTFKEYAYIEEKTSVGYWKKRLENDGVYIITDYLLELLHENKSDSPNSNECHSELDTIVAGDGIDISSDKHEDKFTVKIKKSYSQRVKDYIPSFQFGTKEVFDSKAHSISTFGFIYLSIKNKFYNFQISLTESRSNGWFFPELDYKLIKMSGFDESKIF